MQSGDVLSLRLRYNASAHGETGRMCLREEETVALLADFRIHLV